MTCLCFWPPCYILWSSTPVELTEPHNLPGLFTTKLPPNSILQRKYYIYGYELLVNNGIVWHVKEYFTWDMHLTCNIQAKTSCIKMYCLSNLEETCHNCFLVIYDSLEVSILNQSIIQTLMQQCFVTWVHCLSFLLFLLEPNCLYCFVDELFQWNRISRVIHAVLHM